MRQSISQSFLIHFIFVIPTKFTSNIIKQLYPCWQILPPSAPLPPHAPSSNPSPIPDATGRQHIDTATITEWKKIKNYQN